MFNINILMHFFFAEHFYRSSWSGTTLFLTAWPMKQAVYRHAWLHRKGGFFFSNTGFTYELLTHSRSLITASLISCRTGWGV